MDHPTIREFGVDSVHAHRLGPPCGRSIQLVIEPLGQNSELATLMAMLQKHCLVYRTLTLPSSGIPVDMPAAISKGEYLTKAADCVACHTAKGGAPFAGGRAFKLPFGTIYSTNLTSDKDTGIGSMSDGAFVDAVRRGVGTKGHLYPAMPYTSYSAMSRDDVLAIKQYLLTLPPIANNVDSNTLSFPFNQRWGMTFWDIVFFKEHRFVPVSDKSAEWNRGAYLATALGHCSQ